MASMMRTCVICVTGIIGVSSCARSEITTGRDHAFDGAVLSVQAEADVRGSGLDMTLMSIQFGDAEGFTAKCHQTPAGNYIVVDEREWRRLSLMDQQYVIAHELGHCVIGLKHDQRMDIVTIGGQQISRPHSIMWPWATAVTPWDAEFHKQYYNELLGGTPQ